MSLSRKKRPLARKLTAFRLSSEVNWPETRIAIFSTSAFTRAAGLDGVLRLQGLHQLGNVEPHGGELLGGELQVNFLVLGAEEIDLCNVRHAEQLGAHALGIVAQLALSETIRSQREDQRIGVAELVIEERPLHPLGQGLLDVADLLAHLIPEIRHIGRTGGILQIHEHHGLAGLGVALADSRGSATPRASSRCDP